jgi:hypothetical protein
MLLNNKALSQDFGMNADAARTTMAELTQLKSDVAAIDEAFSALEDAQAALELGREMGDEEVLEESSQIAENLSRRLDELELASWFTE